MVVSSDVLSPAQTVLHELRAAGLEVMLSDDGGITVSGPTEAMTPALAARITTHLTEIIHLLLAERDAEVLERLDAVNGTDEWGATYDPDADALLVTIEQTLPPPQPMLSNTGRSWWCPCGASVVVGWAVCSFCGTRGDHLWTSQSDATNESPP
jgi:hypothetical protein